MEEKEKLVAFGNKIKELRKAQSLSCVELAKKMGVPRSKIERIEKGEVNLRFYSIVKILKALGVEDAGAAFRGF
jgi:transcriptional regulator with XRE-family HTH domain